MSNIDIVQSHLPTGMEYEKSEYLPTNDAHQPYHTGSKIDTMRERQRWY
jgi:hypothetical protein